MSREYDRLLAALSEPTELQYLCTGNYNPKGESGIVWNDPRIGIDWPVKEPILSDKDAHAQTLEQWLARPESDHFTFKQ